mgnify:CR=1 FL=1
MQDGNFIISWDGKQETVCNISELHLFGGHNEENVLAAIACGFFAGVSISDMADVLRNFRSIEHRIEYVATIDGVPYYNDSKATNTDSTIKALEPSRMVTSSCSQAATIADAAGADDGAC